MLAFVFAICSCGYAAGTNRIHSGDYLDKKQRLEVLKKYIRMHTPVADAIYDIYDVNLNARLSIPGPTHRDYRVALVVKNDDARKWLAGATLTSFPQDASWCHKLLAGNAAFTLRHKAEVWTYSGKNKTVFHFEKDGVLCLRVF